MLKQFEGARLGLFIFLGTVLIFIAIFLIGNRESLFVDTIEIESHFSSIEGLRSGASVQLSGLNVGSVSNVELVDSPNNRVKVTMRIEKEVQNFIRIDSKALIQTEGLVGAKIVSITPGSPNLDVIKDGGTIKSESPINFGEIIKESQGVIQNLRFLTSDFAEVVEKVNKGEGTIGKLVNDDKLYASTVKITETADKSLKSITQRMNQVSDFLVNMGDQIESIIGEVDGGMKDLRGLIRQINSGDGTVGNLISKSDIYDSLKVVMNNLTEATKFAKDGAVGLSENMEALKHNWLFKSYFEQRGYWDKADYENQIDDKLQRLNEQNKMLDKKLEELKKLGEEIEINRINSKE